MVKSDSFIRDIMKASQPSAISRLAMREENVLKFQILQLQFSNDRVFFTTEKGYFGTAPDRLSTTVEPGDVIAIVAGLRVPLILRRFGLWYSVIGQGYLHGVMHGEAVAGDEWTQPFEMVDLV